MEISYSNTHARYNLFNSTKFYFFVFVSDLGFQLPPGFCSEGVFRQLLDASYLGKLTLANLKHFSWDLNSAVITIIVSHSFFLALFKPREIKRGCRTLSMSMSMSHLTSSPYLQYGHFFLLSTSILQLPNLQ